jgi:hypothetical protein
MTELERLTYAYELAHQIRAGLNGKFPTPDVERRVEVAYVRIDQVIRELAAARDILKGVQP